MLLHFFFLFLPFIYRSFNKISPFFSYIDMIAGMEVPGIVMKDVIIITMGVDQVKQLSSFKVRPENVVYVVHRRKLVVLESYIQAG